MIGHTKNGGVNSRDGDGDRTSSTSRCGPESISYCYPGYWCPPASITPIQKRCGNVRFLHLIGVRSTHPKYFYSLSHVCTIHFFASTSSRPLLRVNFFFFLPSHCYERRHRFIVHGIIRTNISIAWMVYGTWTTSRG